MSADPHPIPQDLPAAQPALDVPAQQPVVSRSWGLVLAAIAVLSLVLGVLLWQRLSSIQEQLARQSADAGLNATEARTMAKLAQEQARDTAARLALTEAKLSEVSLQRTQLEELMQSLSRSRDENLVVDIESAIRLAQQQSQLTGSVEPLLAALRSADQRVGRAAQPRLNALQRAINRDVTRIKATTVSDMPALLIRMDELVRLADDVPLANAVLSANESMSGGASSTDSRTAWWQRSLRVLEDEARKLVRVSRIEQPEAALLSPEQSFFLRENLKLKLLNARLGLLARQLDASRADLASASVFLGKYYDLASPKTQAAVNLLRQLQVQMKQLELPRVDETLAALATAAAGR